MIQVFCKERGYGKTKELISLANRRVMETKGDSVYIDDNLQYIMQIDRRIRFVSIDDYDIVDYKDFYGLLCGIVSGNYDIENIYVDGFFSKMVNIREDIKVLFSKLESLSKKFNINIYININNTVEEVPDFIRNYVA